MSLTNVFNVAGTGMNAQSVRLNTTASNIANAETVSSSIDETYRARKPWFQALQKEWDDIEGLSDKLELRKGVGDGVHVAAIVESDAPLKRRFEPHHPMADEEGYVMYPNVNIVEEMTDMMSSSRSYQMNVEMMKTAKQMLQRTLTLGQ
ncbi:flagellar basal body rod protein FlgC [Bermanella marisrubri]|uniref:Flagellar basal-body rod protein FlgC n=1 Tax=Bermanella marisrubri TaxID=207949 RepID=Q1N304_9GAMM|nr:flagellar basal body rod protein FlgC [Bermanella marisrubri]EAT12515.1 flagellar basal-body rod protein FlgC [Oceanobacter sp. RED65] [Bermanella marisrubri]QIZ84925.1 flagellar basal body rod protein FlgC [Bermanella marisrubri]